MQIKFKTIPMDKEWKGIAYKKGWTKDSPFLDEFQIKYGKNQKLEQYKQLRDKLLDVAGESVCMYHEEDLHNILARGVFLRGYNAMFMTGEACRCHENSARLWDANRKRLLIATGYALSRDGMWRQHSWCVSKKSNRVVETTEKRLLYYGFIMTDKETELNAMNYGIY